MAQLIVYYSRRGENYVSGSIQTLAVGNTEAVARRLQALTGADLFQLEPMSPTPTTTTNASSKPRTTSGGTPAPP